VATILHWGTEMGEPEQPDQEPEATQEEQPLAVSKGRQSLSRIKRELTDDELKSPAVQKLLIDDLDRLDRECSELLDYRERFHSTDKKVGILQEKLRRSISSEIISSSCFVVGAAALGYTPALWSSQPAGYISIAFGTILIAAGIWAKAVKA
jgi:hypothetical protein